MVNVKKKGNAGENKFANWLISNGIKAWKDGQSGGGNNEKADVGNNINIHFEVKTVKKIGIQEVWKKAEHECQKTHNTPVIAIHFDGMPENTWLMVLHSEDWLGLMLKETGVKNDYLDPKFKWALKTLLESVKRVLKFIENI